MRWLDDKNAQVLLFLSWICIFLGQSTYLSYRFLKYNTTSFLLAHQNERRTTRTVKTQTKIRYDHSGISKPTWKSECQFGHAHTLVSAFRNYQQKLWCKRLWCQEAVWDMQQWGEAKSLKMFSTHIQDPCKQQGYECSKYWSNFVLY